MQNRRHSRPRPHHRSHHHRWLTAIALVALAASTVVVAAGSPRGAEAASTCTSPGAATHLVADGDTWFEIAVGAEVSLRALVDANDASADTTIHPGDVLCLPSGATTRSSCSPSNAPTHTVSSGDTWWDIAARAGASMSRLLSLNGASDTSIIRPGDDICLPVGSSTTSSAASASSGSSGSTASSATRSSGGIEALPMQGPCWFSDSWGDPRGAGRTHQGSDLFAEPRSLVYAVVDGTLTRRAWDQPGLRSGNAWWLTSADGSGTYYFYAHLADFAPGLRVGSRVEAGQIIGFMGNTGNSAFPHLHFEIHPNGGGAVNPHSLLRSLGGCKTGSGYRQPGGWVPD